MDADKYDRFTPGDNGQSSNIVRAAIDEICREEPQEAAVERVVARAVRIPETGSPSSSHSNWREGGVIDQPPDTDVDAPQRHQSQSVGCLDQHRTIASTQRRRMMTRVAVFVAATAVLAGVWFGISHFAADGDGSNAFARTFEGIEKAKTVTWKKTFYMRCISRDGKRTWLKLDTRQCEYKSPGLYREVDLDEKGQVASVKITDAARKPQRQLCLSPADNEATLSVPARDPQDPHGQFAGLKNQMEDADLQWVEARQTASGTVNVFRESCRDKVNGRDWSYDYWIDQKTKQLVEYHVPGADIFDYPNEPDRDNPPEKRFSTGTMLAHAYHDIVFNSELDDSLFSLEPPKGYTVKTEGRRRPVTENEMIDYLGVLADFNDKTFPDKLFPLSFADDREKKLWDKPKEDRTAVEHKFIDTRDRYSREGLNSMPTGHFHRDHTVEGTWRYLGKGVKLGDKDRIVCWYKLKDAKDAETYRVVYGDLSVKDVAPKDLPLPVQP